MKKLMIALAFAGLGTVAANAQTTIEAPSKYTVATNGFWDNIFVQVGVDMAVQNPYRSKLFKENWHDGRTYGVNVAVGKWFTPGLGLRLKVNWENGIIKRNHLGFYPTEHGAPAMDGGTAGPYMNGLGLVANTYHTHGYGVVTGDVLFNLSNLFFGYSDTRVWNLIAFPRAGVMRHFDAKNSYSPVLGLGLESAWKISKRIGLYIDLAYHLTPKEGVTNNRWLPYYTGNGNNMNNESKYQYKTYGWFTADLGLTFNIGKVGFDKAVSLEAYNALAARSEEALARLRADLDRERALNADLRAQLAKWANHKCQGGDGPVNVIANAATSVFFDINSSKINSKKDLINLESVAATAKAQNAKVQVVGSADSKTGSAAYNQKLSEARANAVADELVNLGVSRDKIEVKAVGGINEVSPFNLNRRAVVTLK
jgi:outer membrane protein OmpA-like peptidoglycan-associated protein